MSSAPRPDSTRSWLLLGVLVAGYMGVYLCRKNYAVAMPLLRDEFHATKEEVERGAVTDATISLLLVGTEIKKIIVVPGRLVNIVAT